MANSSTEPLAVRAAMSIWVALVARASVPATFGVSVNVVTSNIAHVASVGPLFVYTTKSP